MSIKSDLLSYLQANTGKVVHLDEMVKALKLTPRQVQSNLGNLRADTIGTAYDLRLSIRVVVHGQQWLFEPVMLPTAPATSPQGKLCFESVGSTKDGSLIIQCEDGTLWKAVSL